LYPQFLLLHVVMTTAAGERSDNQKQRKRETMQAYGWVKR
jgi:hypothetical protein